MTKSGIERDLKITPYYLKLNYPNGNEITYYFSSQLSLDRFDSNLGINRKTLRESLLNRFRIKFKLADDFCDLQLYRRIESRGFRIVINGSEVEWLGRLEYSGQKLYHVS